MKILKVTDPAKIVTDPVVIRELERLNIDADYVEFNKDYSAEHPYAKVYRDLMSKKRFMVVSGLPMVRKFDGKKIEVRWEGGAGRFIAEPNLFSAFVNHGRIDLAALNDQPNGIKQGNTVSWEPQLTIGGTKYTAGEPVLLEVDPMNEHYRFNTLEWDYEVCKRRLRIIEGMIHERWVFAGKPHGEVRIKHNQTGDFRLRLGRGIDADGIELPVLVESGDEEVLADPGLSDYGRRSHDLLSRSSGNM